MCLNERVVYVHGKDGYLSSQKVRCGACIECMLRDSNEWAFRIMDEASLYEENCFVTLTYDDAHLPPNSQLCKPDLQKFIKRLRRAISPVKIRFFACGEYGSNGHRPHYHLIIFNWKPKDLLVFHPREKLFRSPLIEKEWSFGFSSVGDLTSQSAKYCAKYCSKLNHGNPLEHKKGWIRPFVQMSLKPGIGFGCVYKRDLPADGMYYVDGRRVPVPRYYLSVMESDGIDLTSFKESRSLNAACCSILFPRHRRAEKFLKFFNKNVLKP